MHKAARSSLQTRRLIYRLYDASNSARNSDRRTPQGSGAARSAASLLSLPVLALPGSGTVFAARRPTARLARDRGFRGARVFHLARSLAMPQLRLRVYRLPRLSYCLTNASPRPACWNWRETISNATGRPIAKRPVPAACPSGMNEPLAGRKASSARCTWRRSGNS